MKQISSLYIENRHWSPVLHVQKKEDIRAQENVKEVKGNFPNFTINPTSVVMSIDGTWSLKWNCIQDLMPKDFLDLVSTCNTEIKFYL